MSGGVLAAVAARKVATDGDQHQHSVSSGGRGQLVGYQLECQYSVSNDTSA